MWITSPSAAERAQTFGSPGPGTLTAPSEASLMYIRRSVPAMQRRPSPRCVAGAIELPCTTKLSAEGASYALERSSESDPTLGFPEAESRAPAEGKNGNEFRQPCPGEPLFA